MQLSIHTLLTLLTPLIFTLVTANPIPAANPDLALKDMYGGTCYYQKIDRLACKKSGLYPAGCCCSKLKKVVDSCGLLVDYSKELKNVMKKCDSKC